MTYLQPEPLLQNPRFASAMAKEWLSSPTYAYAANNPIRFVDRNGRFFTSSDQGVWQALLELRADPNIGPLIEEMAVSQTTEFHVETGETFGLFSRIRGWIYGWTACGRLCVLGQRSQSYERTSSANPRIPGDPGQALMGAM